MVGCRWAVKPLRSRCQRFQRTRFLTTWQLASRWTRQARMRSRGSRRAGFLGSKGTTAMWWDCQLRSCIECCGRPKCSDHLLRHRPMNTRTRVSAPHELGLLLGVLLVVFFYCRLEVSDAFAQTFAQIGKLARTEQQERDAHNQDDMQRLEQTLTHNFLHCATSDGRGNRIRSKPPGLCQNGRGVVPATSGQDALIEF